VKTQGGQTACNVVGHLDHAPHLAAEVTHRRIFETVEHPLARKRLTRVE
jgi:hypothetical protein